MKNLPESPGEPLTATGLAAFLAERLAISARTPLRVAYSGGLDSHVLLHCLARSPGTGAGSLAAVHVHHGLNPQADHWARHCQQVCTDLGVPFEVLHVKVSPRRRHSLQALAREARYRALAGALPPGGVLLTGHHQLDQAETVVLMMLRAGGVRGLAGMPLSTPFPPGRLARPLLNVSPAALAQYAAAADLVWIDDPANADPRHARSRLRHAVWPALDKAFPGAAAQIARTARHAAEAQALLDDLARADLAACGRPYHGLLPSPVCELSVVACRGLPAARLGNLLRFWLHEGGERVPPGPAQAEMARQLLQGESGGTARVIVGAHSVRRYRDRMVLVADRPPPVGARLPWSPGQRLVLPGLPEWRVESATVRGQGVRAEALAGHRVEMGVGGGVANAHRLKHLFQAAGVPGWERPYYPLLFIDGELAALAGRPPAAGYRARHDEPGIDVRLVPVA